MDEKIEQYIVDIVYATRKPDQYKLSDLTHDLLRWKPPASINMALAAKAWPSPNAGAM
jgi:MoxR-like ATPase